MSLATLFMWIAHFSIAGSWQCQPVRGASLNITETYRDGKEEPRHLYGE